MSYQQKPYKKRFQLFLSAQIMSGFVLCLLLLSACNPSNHTVSSTTSPQAPTIDVTLKHQADTQLQTFQQWISLMKQYGGNITSYQQQYSTDQQAVQNATTNTAYNTVLAKLSNHVNAIQIPAMQAESQMLQQQLKQQVTSWGQSHSYHDAYDNATYPLDYEYGDNGIGGWVQDDLSSAQTVADYQQAIENLNMYLTNFQAMVANMGDTTPYNQPHKTDMQLMQHFGKANSQVLVVSMTEQAMRVYENGKLVNAFLVTTGRPDRPTPPGSWWVESKQSPTVFKSGVPQGSPDWYPDTPITYAMQYHSNGYFIHEAWWRADYGPGTNFPHQDSTGDPFSASGSHGCINLSTNDTAWIYGFVKLYTSVIVY